MTRTAFAHSLAVIPLLFAIACGSSSGPILSVGDQRPEDARSREDRAGPPDTLPDLLPVDLPTAELTDASPDLPGPDLPDAIDLVPEIAPDADVLPDVGTPDVEPDLADAGDLLDLPPDLPDLSDLPDAEPDLLDQWEEPDLPTEVEEELVEEIVPQCPPLPDPPATPPAGKLLTAADFTLVGKAEPDETYTTPQGIQLPKTNQAYVWAIAREGTRTWIGTVANTLCLGFTGFGGVSLGYGSNNAVCEQSSGQELFPDWRLPELWEYDSATSAWTRRTEPEGTAENPGIAQGVQGWRAAIGIDDYLMIAGPGLGFLWGMPDYGTAVVLYKDGQYVGSQKFSEHNDARKFLAVGDQVYLGSFRWDGKGIILRWDRDESAPPDSLFTFSEVGVIDGSAAWLEYYAGRIYAITWNTALAASNEGFEVWRSPVIPPCGLDESHAEQWEKVFSYSDYDATSATAKLAAGGAMIVFRGALYFGSMHVPFSYSCSDPGNLITCALEKYLYTHAISLFRLTEDAQGKVTTTCLFGQDKGGAYQPAIGPPGFGNHYNNYTWSMAVHDGWLYVGTMDYSFFLEDSLAQYGLPADFPGKVPIQQHGFDLWASSDGNGWVPVTTNGLGNLYNWGARHLLSDGETLWLGTANPFNLNPAGGWELWRAQ
jgi:hypothetical protein